MLCGYYRFHGTLLDDAVLPEAKESVFRNTFGPALRHVVCAMKQKECAGCILDRRCLYPFVFSSSPPANHHLLPPFPRGKIRSSATPSPFIVEPPETTKTLFKRGDAFDFQLLLFGRINDHLPHFIQAFGHMGRLGIGRRTEKGRARFALVSVTARGETIFDDGGRQIREDDFAEDLKAVLLRDLEAPVVAPVNGLTLHLETPLAGVIEERRETALPFPVLMQAVLRRISLLCRTYGKGEPNIDSPGLLSRAGAVRTVAASLRRMDRDRASRRRDASVPAGGIMGEATYEGALGEFLPYLRFCERTHLGGQTAWGSGKIRIVEKP
jgi:hypothetical protein